MNWWDYVNPFTALSNAADKVIADAWTVAMLGLWNAGLWLLNLVLSIEDAFMTPDLTESGPMSGIYPMTFWIAGALALVLLLVQLGMAAAKRDGQSLARVIIGTVQFGAVCVAWVTYAVAVLAAAGGLTNALMQSLLHVEALSAWEPFSGFSTADISDGALATVLGVLGVFLIFSAFGHLLIMMARAAALLVLAATNPIAAAGLVYEGGRSWFWKAFRWFHAAAFSPVIMMLMLGLGVQVTTKVSLGYSDSLQQAIGTAVPGIMLILLGCFTPLALFKLLAFVDPGTSSGAAMRSGLAAQGGIQGLLNRGGAESMSTAASTSDASGQAQGEASIEAATNDRMTASAGGLMTRLGPAGQAAATGLGMIGGLASSAAVLGADLTNQMGVGHNTYVPDFSSGRGRRGKSAKQGGDDVPDINGSGAGGAGSAGSAGPGAPDVGPTAGPGAGHLARLGAAGPGGAAGAGGASGSSGAVASEAATVALL